MKQKRFKIEYKDSTEMRCIQIVYSKSEKKAIQELQFDLVRDGGYMTQLIDIQEVEEGDGEWTLEDGTELDQDSQDILNDAMSTYTNSEGLTLEQAMERAYSHKNK